MSLSEDEMGVKLIIIIIINSRLHTECYMLHIGSYASAALFTYLQIKNNQQNNLFSKTIYTIYSVEN